MGLSPNSESLRLGEGNHSVPREGRASYSSKESGHGAKKGSAMLPEAEARNTSAKRKGWEKREGKKKARGTEVNRESVEWGWGGVWRVRELL